MGSAAPAVARGGGGTGGGSDTASTELLSYLQANRCSAKFLLATFGAMAAAPYITATGDNVLPIGGFDGQDLTPTRAAFQDLVSTGQLRFVLAGAGQQTNGSIGEWVAANCAKVTYSTTSSTVLYDCAAK